MSSPVRWGWGGGIVGYGGVEVGTPGCCAAGGDWGDCAFEIKNGRHASKAIADKIKLIRKKRWPFEIRTIGRIANLCPALRVAHGRRCEKGTVPSLLRSWFTSTGIASVRHGVRCDLLSAVRAVRESVRYAPAPLQRAEFPLLSPVLRCRKGKSPPSPFPVSLGLLRGFS